MLGRSLLALRTIIDRSIAEARMSGSGLLLETIPVGRLLDDSSSPPRSPPRAVACVSALRENRQALVNCRRAGAGRRHHEPAEQRHQVH